jgi:hypothetical protein
MHRISHTNPKYIKRNRFFSFSFYIHRISHTNPIFHLTYIHRTSLARTLLYTHMLLTPLSLSIYLSISLSLSLSVSFSFCLCLSLSVSVSLPLSLCLLSHSLSLFSRILPSRAHTPSRTLARSPPPPPPSCTLPLSLSDGFQPLPVHAQKEAILFCFVKGLDSGSRAAAVQKARIVAF